MATNRHFSIFEITNRHSICMSLQTTRVELIGQTIKKFGARTAFLLALKSSFMADNIPY